MLGMWQLLTLLLVAQIAGEVESDAQAAEPSWWDALYAETQKAGFRDIQIKDFTEPWLGVNFERLSEALGNRIAPHQDLSVVLLGSGDSRLPQELLKAGFGRVAAVDFSEGAAAVFQAEPGIELLMEDARKQTSLPASSFDLVVELGTLDTAASAKDNGEGAEGLVREARRLLRGGGKFVSASIDSPVFRLPFLAQHPAGGWSGQAEVLRLPRPEDFELDRRVKELDPSWEVDKLFLYVSTAAGQVEIPPPRSSPAAEATAEPSSEEASPAEEGQPGETPEPTAGPPPIPPPSPPPKPPPMAPPAPPVEVEGAFPPAPPIPAEGVAPPAPPIPAEEASPPAPQISAEEATPPAPNSPEDEPSIPPEEAAAPEAPPAPPRPPSALAQPPAPPIPPLPPAPPPVPRPPLPTEETDLTTFDSGADMSAEDLAAAAAAAEAAYAQAAAMATPEDQAQATAYAMAAALEAEAAAAASQTP